MTHPVVAALRSDDPEERRAACVAAADDASAVLLAEALCEALESLPQKVASECYGPLFTQRGKVHYGQIDALNQLAYQRPDDLDRAWPTRYDAANSFVLLQAGCD